MMRAIPETVYSSVSFAAFTRWEWTRKSDVKEEMSRFLFENGIFE
jgi:hypothetical protein